MMTTILLAKKNMYLKRKKNKKLVQRSRAADAVRCNTAVDTAATNQRRGPVTSQSRGGGAERDAPPTAARKTKAEERKNKKKSQREKEGQIHFLVRPAETVRRSLDGRLIDGRSRLREKERERETERLSTRKRERLRGCRRRFIKTAPLHPCGSQPKKSTKKKKNGKQKKNAKKCGKKWFFFNHRCE